MTFQEWWEKHGGGDQNDYVKVMCESAFKENKKALDALREILIRAYKYDDKPHQLYSSIAAAANTIDHEEKEEIARLMHERYMNEARDYQKAYDRGLRDGAMEASMGEDL